MILFGFDFVGGVEDAARREFDCGKHAGQISASINAYQAVAQPDLFAFTEDHPRDRVAENDRLAVIFREKSTVARPIKLRTFGGLARVQKGSVVAFRQ